MDPADLTPRQARAAGYEYLAVYHCQMTVHLWLEYLPDIPVRRIRYRCQRCGAPLSPEEASAELGRMTDALGYVQGFRYPR
ncbi:hypothetical protein [Xanthobacter tagetidis]|uniref:Uncharacterized protein n=1 Tax=Xanthobacter tagetidis TaxID=60216 RepID=A0A3L7AH24_9HYPH|nr:hypothetical protein [Xanthobacter tagetidis]MBB6306193.1 CHASE1-domain containing sensor protein [Xanthobacter tagetidis]RLP79477.1 hypothetical protein D9R14_07380 [Xanthobacter tagetidis]